MAYAEPQDLATWLGEDFDADETTRAQMLLDLATGEVDDVLEQNLEQVTDDQVVLDGTGTDTLVLPSWPVTAISALDEDGTSLTQGDDYVWSRSGVVTRKRDVWPSLPRSVEVTFTHGYTTIPEVIRSATVKIAAASWVNPAGVRSESIGDYSYRVEAPADGSVAAELERVRKFSAGGRAR